jgi:ribonuclease HI
MAVQKYMNSIIKESSALPEVVIHTDGGCAEGFGGWAYVARTRDGTISEYSGFQHDTTNNRMEMLAVIKALEAVKERSRLWVVSDSQYVVKGLTEWSKKWIRTGWKKSDGTEVLNRDLWLLLIAESDKHVTTLHWVKGHAGNHWNERCDELCQQAIKAARNDQGTVYGHAS